MVTIVTNQPLPNINGGHDTVFGRQATAAQQMRQVLVSQLKQTLRRSDWGPSLGSTGKSCPFPDDKRHQKTGLFPARLQVDALQICQQNHPIKHVGFSQCIRVDSSHSSQLSKYRLVTQWNCFWLRCIAIAWYKLAYIPGLFSIQSRITVYLHYHSSTGCGCVAQTPCIMNQRRTVPGLFFQEAQAPQPTSHHLYQVS